MRAPPSQADRQLSALAIQWLASLPVAEQPSTLCERYPRIANRLALVWPDMELTDRYVESLVIDRRGGRQGFAPAIMAELIRLRAFRAAQSRQSGVQVQAVLQMKPIDFDR